MKSKALLLTSAAFFLAPTAASAQETDSPGSLVAQEPQAEQSTPVDDLSMDEDVDGQTVVVTGSKPRGSVVGDIPPENTLTSRDIQATGATDINELLEAIAPQIGSARGRSGGRPVMLLNGQRISSFRELRDIPTEAISRVEILPEEVALKYGYSADQKVVNIVLRPRFRSTTALVSPRIATEGGYLGATADATRLMIGKNGRTTVNLHAEGNSALSESERDIRLQQPLIPGDLDPRAARTLIGSKRDVRGTVTVKRQLGQVGATGNVELEHNEGRSLIGLGETLVEPLARTTNTDSAYAGGVLDGNAGQWRWSVTGNADGERAVTKTERDSGLRDRATTTTLSADVKATAHGNLFKLPGGDASATLNAGGSTLHLDSERVREGVTTHNSLGRTTGSAGFNVDVPISRRNSKFAVLGNLSVSANGQVEQLSDFGTLTTVGAGLNWSPLVRLNFIGSWTREEGAPTVHQLGDLVLETPGTRIFDFTTSETVLVNAITGGNADLEADRRNVWKLGANWKPFSETDLTLRGEYVHSAVNRPISNVPGPTAALEAAFPERFVRDGDGNLVSVDLRPVNYDRARRDTLRIGFDFSKPLKSAAPSQAAIAAFRARREAASGASGQQRPPQGQEEAQAQDRSAGRGGGFGRFGGNRNRGRLQFSVTDTVTLVDGVTIRDGLQLDYLHGDAFGQSGGRPRHQVEARAGYFNNGLGARLSANWRSGTQVTTATGDDLRFSPLATFDLRLWANLGQKYELVAKHPFFRGTSVRLEVDNLFDSKPRVRDAVGAVPFNYQPDLLDPLGRTVSITFRKLFLPPPSFFRRGGGRGGDD